MLDLRIAERMLDQMANCMHVYRLIQQPLCVKVPKEVCVNAQVNPQKVSRIHIKKRVVPGSSQ